MVLHDFIDTSDVEVSTHSNMLYVHLNLGPILFQSAHLELIKSQQLDSNI